MLHFFKVFEIDLIFVITDCDSRKKEVSKDHSLSNFKNHKSQRIRVMRQNPWDTRSLGTLYSTRRGCCLHRRPLSYVRRRRRYLHTHHQLTDTGRFSVCIILQFFLYLSIFYITNLRLSITFFQLDLIWPLILRLKSRHYYH